MRRSLQILGSVFFSLLGIMACSDPGVSQNKTDPASVPSESFFLSQEDLALMEAPMLSERVAQGELPPLGERIPQNPRVLEVVDSLGRYGGTLRRGYSGPGDRWGPSKLIEERILEYQMNEAGEITIVPNWVDLFEANADNTSFFFHIREGLRWSDGEPVTTEDVRFWYEDLLLNEELTPSPPGKLVIEGELARIVIVDDYSFRVVFSAPYSFFPETLATGNLGPFGLQGESFVAPFHYLKNFHPRYTAKARLEEMAQSYGLDSWTDLWHFGPIQSWFLNPDIPVLSAWTMKVPPPAQSMIMERNPYYHGVDSAGRQLPYIDIIENSFFDVSDTLELWVVQGEIDLQSRHISERRYSLYKRNEDSGGYSIVFWTNSNTEALFLNPGVEDPQLRGLFVQKDFRQALSLALDREVINQQFYGGLGQPRQASPVTSSIYYDPDFESKWVSHDPQEASLLLDSLGLDQKDAQGMRLLPDGSPLRLTISQISGSLGDSISDLVAEQWRQVGLETRVDYMERLEYEESADQGKMQIGIWSHDRNVIVPSDPLRYLGVITDGPWAPLYGRWYFTGGREGIEPPVDHAIRQVWTAWDRAKSATSREAAIQAVRDMIAVHKENIWIIGLVGAYPKLIIKSNRIGNFPDNYPNDDPLRDIGLSQPAQWFFKELP